MGTYTIEATGVNSQTLETILTDVYSLQVTRRCKPFIIFTPTNSRTSTELKVEWLGKVEGLELNKQNTRKQLQKTLCCAGEVVVERRRIVRR